ncbi:uncharacterized protein LOC115209589 [Argonauta hians]
MKLIVFEIVLFGVLLRLLPVMSLICPVNPGLALAPLTRIADVICEGIVKKAPSNVHLNSLKPYYYGTDQENITIIVRRVLKGKKKIKSRSELYVNIPYTNQQDACIYSLRKGDKRLFHLITYNNYYTMISAPIGTTKSHNRKIRRIINTPDKTYIKRIKKVEKGSKVKFACTTPNDMAKFRWLKNGKLIRNTKDMSRKKQSKKKGKRVIHRSVLRIRKVTKEHGGSYTCAINIKGKKHFKDFFLIVTQPSEIQCEDQHYCLNNGECWYRLPPLDEKYCKCPINYNGKRCERLHEPIKGQFNKLTSAVIVLGALLALFTIILSIILVCFLCKRCKKRKRKHNISPQYGSFIQSNSKGETYCHIPSEDSIQPDLYLKPLMKTTDNIRGKHVEESTFSEVPPTNYNEKCIPNGNAKLMQSFSFNMLPSERVNDIPDVVVSKMPKRHRLSAVSSATQLAENEALSDGLDITLPETQVIYAEPNHCQHNLPVEGRIDNLNNELPCDSPLKCDGSLQTDFLNEDQHSLIFRHSGSNRSSTDSEDQIKLHISEEDLRESAEPKTSSSTGKIQPKPMFSNSKFSKANHYSIPVSERYLDQPYTYKSNNSRHQQTLISAVGKPASKLQMSGYQTSVDSCGGEELTRDKSLSNFAF